MSKIEEALKKLEIQDSGKALALPPHPAPEVPRPPSRRVEVDREVLVHHRIVTVTDPRAPASEEYRKLKAKVLQMTRTRGLNALLVTSASYGEGKSTTAVNLAISIAEELHQTALLVDADLRNPSLHHYLGLSPAQGLSEYLRGDGLRLDQVLLKTPVPKLTLLPAGTPLDKTSEWFSSQKMAQLVKEIKERYPDRYVIYDTMPILPAADTGVLSTLVDGVVLVVQWGRSRQDDVQKALSLIDHEKLLGVVVNNVSIAFKAYNAYYHGGYAGSGSIRASSGTGWLTRVKRSLWRS